MSPKTVYIATAVSGFCLLFLHYYYNAHEANADIEKGVIHRTYTYMMIYVLYTYNIKIVPRFFYWIVQVKLHVEKKE